MNSESVAELVPQFQAERTQDLLGWVNGIEGWRLQAYARLAGRTIGSPRKRSSEYHQNPQE